MQQLAVLETQLNVGAGERGVGMVSGLMQQLAVLETQLNVGAGERGDRHTGVYPCQLIPSN